MASNKLIFGAILVAGILSGCKEEVSTLYPDYTHAQQAQLFDKGWLPSIIPTSVENIQTENNLDTNTSEGHFIIGLEHDLVTFKQQLQMLDEKDQYKYQEDGSTWTFSIEEYGNVYYTMSPTQALN